MHRDEMLSLFHQHRKAEAARDFDAIMATFVEDCYLETVALNLRIEGRAQARAAYEGYFTAFPDLTPDDGEDVLVTWERCGAPARAPSWAFPRADGPLRCRS